MATLVKPQGQTPPFTTIVYTPPPSPLVTTATAALTRETRVRWKRLRGASFEQPETILDSGNSPLDLGDTHVDVTGAPAYTKVFMVDGEVLPSMDRVRPWRDGRGGKIAKCVGKALLLLEDIKHWAKWDNDTLLLNMKRETIMIINYFLAFLKILIFL